MKAEKLILFAIVLIALTGCAVMDTSVMDTAEPMKPGHVKLESFASMGVILESAVYEEEDDGEVTESNNVRSAGMWPVMGLKLAIGIPDSSEVGAKGWLSSSTTGVKAYFKKQVYRKGNVYHALIPALTYSGIKTDNSDDEYNGDYGDVNYSDYKYSSIGFELPYLITTKLAEEVALTTAVRANYNYLEYQYVNNTGALVKRGPYNIFHAGVLVNARVKLGWVVVTPEVGVELVPVINGDFTMLPNVGLTLGLQF